jgi:hypothetical protein
MITTSGPPRAVLRQRGRLVPTAAFHRIAALGAVLACLASAARAQPIDTTRQILERTPQITHDLTLAIGAATAARPYHAGDEPADERPWDSDTSCAQPMAQRVAAIGGFFAAHVEPPGEPPAAGAAPPYGAAALAPYGERMNAFFEGIARIPLAGNHPTYMTPGNLDRRPANWGEAAALRAEWYALLRDSDEIMVEDAGNSTRFRYNYSAAVFTTLECGLLTEDVSFLAALDASGETITDPRQLAAVATLRSMHQPPPPTP